MKSLIVKGLNLFYDKKITYPEKQNQFRIMWNL